jgi:hypothetical protein
MDCWNVNHCGYQPVNISEMVVICIDRLNKLPVITGKEGKCGIPGIS